MKTMKLKGLFLCLVFLLCNATSHAADDLITRQITIKLDKAGTLPDKIGSSKKYKITNLKIVGEINGADFALIRDMAGLHNDRGKLSVLDLSEAKVVSGGDTSSYYHTYNDYIGGNTFNNCVGLTSLTLPSGVTEIGRSAFSGCSGLTSIYVYAGKLPKMGSDVFNGCDSKKCIVYVPKGEYDDYWLSEFGYFENIVEFAATGIDKVTTSTDAKELSRYSVNGQRLSAPAKGLNIVKYSDGSVKKVAVQ